jgi:hypothetical protein
MADTARIDELLTATASAHHGYEEDELAGQTDEEWAQWYADHALQNDLADALGTTPSSDEVAEVLTEATADHDAEGADTEWSEFAAQRLVDRLA